LPDLSYEMDEPFFGLSTMTGSLDKLLFRFFIKGGDLKETAYRVGTWLSNPAMHTINIGFITLFPLVLIISP